MLEEHGVAMDADVKDHITRMLKKGGKDSAKDVAPHDDMADAGAGEAAGDDDHVKAEEGAPSPEATASGGPKWAGLDVAGTSKEAFTNK